MLKAPIFFFLTVLVRRQDRCLLRSNQGFDGLSLIHCTIARRKLVPLLILTSNE